MNQQPLAQKLPLTQAGTVEQVAVDVPKCSCPECDPDFQILEPTETINVWKCPVTGLLYSFDPAVGDTPQLLEVQPNQQAAVHEQRDDLAPSRDAQGRQLPKVDQGFY